MIYFINNKKLQAFVDYGWFKIVVPVQKVIYHVGRGPIAVVPPRGPEAEPK